MRPQTATPSTGGAATPRPRPWRRVLTGLAALAITAGGVGFSSVAGAVPTTAPPTQLAAVGPVSPDNGFPVWYRDSAGLSLGQCLDPKDPLCGIVATSIPDPAAPVAFPGNFPTETFYMLASSRIALAGGRGADLTTGLESSFATKAGAAPGQQITFGRVRIRIDTPNAGHFTVTHPYGVDQFDAPGAGTRSINFTEDVGVASGVFTGALTSRINPFLTWSTGPITGPSGDRYVGDPAVPHTVTGSALGSNEFRIDGPNIGGPGVNSVSTDLFSLSGKIAKNFGVDAGHPTYSRTSTSGGSVDVFATSIPGEVIEATLPGGSPTTLRADTHGRYFGRLDFSGAPPTTVQVSNVSDSPPTVVQGKVTDLVVAAQASYDNAARTLTVRAISSDGATPPALTVSGFGALDQGGQQVFGSVDAPPQEVLVTSAAGGTDRAPVVIGGAASLPNPVIANAGPDVVVRQGQKVTLDGKGSRSATSMVWSQSGGTAVALTASGTAAVSFTAPDQDAVLTLRLTAQGPGGPATDEVSVTVAGLAPPTAVVPANQAAYAGDVVTLDGSTSAGVDTFAWVQTAGPMVALAGSSTAKPTFTMPATTQRLVFTLATTGPGGVASSQAIVSPVADNLTVSQASYRTSTHEWRFVGTATAPAPDLVTVRLTASGAVVGTAAVDTTGAWAVRVKGSLVAPDGSGTVTVTTSRSGNVAGYVVTVTP